MTEVAIQIPQYPPFTLRSSLIDKDPVIWVHLLEDYIKLFHFLMDDNFQYLTVKSKQQLYQFVKSYLFETYGEENKIFSLGNINVDIQKNEQELKMLVFHTLKLYSLLKFNLIGESIWCFIGIYVKGNNSIVRGLVDGSFKSKFNDNKKSGKISSISSVQGHLEKVIMNGKLTAKDLECLSMLLGQSISGVSTTIGLDNKQRTGKSVNKKASIDFAEKFVNSDWLDIVERSYANGNGINAKTAKEVMIVSVISLPANSISKLVKTVGIDRPSDLIKMPLFGSLVISPELRGLVTGLEQRVRHLVPDMDMLEVEPTDEAIDSLIGIFPDMTIEKARVILKEHDNNAEEVINVLLENPGLISEIRAEPRRPIKPKAEPIKRSKIAKDASPVVEDFTKFKSKKNQNIRINSIDEKLKAQTMKLALSALEDDEEEDLAIYEQFEKYFAGTKLENKSEKSEKLGNQPDQEDDSSKAEDNTAYLFSVYKNEGIGPFLPESREKTLRKHIKEYTGWSDRIIEDWGAMMVAKEEREPKVAEKSKSDKADKRPTSKGSADKSKGSSSDKSKGPISDKSAGANSDKTEKPNSDKKDLKHNDRNKASKANHNRKRGHDKKAKLELQ